MLKRIQFLLILSFFVDWTICNEKLTTLSETKFNSMDINKADILDELNNTKKKVEHCIYRKGVNGTSFEYCCGTNYKNVENIYYGIFKHLEIILENSFSDRIMLICSFDKTPCYRFTKIVVQNMRKSANFSKIKSQLNEVLQNSQVNNNLYNAEISRFQKNYEFLQDTKKIIAAYLLKTVSTVQTYIERSKIHVSFNYKTYNPNEFFKMIQYDPKKDPINQIKDTDFNGELLKEYTPLKLVQSYLYNSIIDKKEVDFNELPSSIIKSINLKPDLIQLYTNKMNHEIIMADQDLISLLMQYYNLEFLPYQQRLQRASRYKVKP